MANQAVKMKAEEPEALGARIRRLRLARRETIRDLAMNADLDLATVWRIETGRNKAPTTRTLRKIADALKVDIEELDPR